MPVFGPLSDSTALTVAALCSLTSTIMEQLAQTLAAGLSDPLAPDICTGCLFCFTDVLQPGERKANLRALRANREFWRGVMLFLTAQRAPDSRVTTERLLHSQLLSCQSRFRTHARHVALFHAALQGSNLLHGAATVLFIVVNICLQDSSQRMVLSQRFSARLWPCSPDDLLPHGADDSFAALLHWFTILDRSAVSDAFLYVVLLGRPQLHIVLMRD